jgi:CCR4-NOT transcription complex subunit 2
MSNQHQSGDDFPPLGRRGDIGPDRRMNIMQNAASGGFGGPAFPSDGPGSRSASDSIRQGPDRGGRGQQNGHDQSIFPELNPSTRPLSGRDSNAPGTSAIGSPNGSGQARSKSPTQMSDRDRYGLGGLLKQIRNSDSDTSNLTIGMDLTNLGLDLNSSEPLYPTFAGPFANGPTRPMQPDFVLPSCYSVTNIHPIEEKIGSLSDETLFYIFYTMPKDVIQEQSAIELTSRNWRYHKGLQTWITKEPGYDDPQIISQDVERGRYILFNQHLWQREQREMILRYADLDDHITTAVPGTLP